MKVSEIFFCSIPVSRVFFGAALLVLSLTTTSVWLCLFLAVMASATIRLLDGSWLTSLRVLGLLRWFVIPILLLHALLTPGQLLWPGFPVAVSREGLLQGIWLSVHLISMYMLAILMFRLLHRHEWLYFMLRLPGIGERLLVQILMMISMKMHMAELLFYLRQQYALRRDWKKTPLLLLSAFRQALQAASAYAQLLWLRWPRQLPSSGLPATSCKPVYQYLFSTIWAGSACLILASLWLS